MATIVLMLNIKPMTTRTTTHAQGYQSSVTLYFIKHTSSSFYLFTSSFLFDPVTRFHAQQPHNTYRYIHKATVDGHLIHSRVQGSNE